MARPLPETELQEAVELVKDWSSLHGARIFITGGTGFFGKWLLEVLGAAERAFNLKIEAVVLSRDPVIFLQTMPHLQNQSWLRFHTGDITTLETPSGRFSHVIHGAASSDARDYARDPMAMYRTIVEGTRRVLEVMAKQDSFRMLFLSSGAVYGPQPPDLEHIPEDYPLPLILDNPLESYAQAKREAEALVVEACRSRGLVCPIARCFAFSGPHLPLDQHFAFGNFVRDALNGGPIRITGDGTPVRSYLYASEMAGWLFTLLIKGGSTTYHVGSDQGLTIRNLAYAIGNFSSVSVEGGVEPPPGIRPARYVPALTRMSKCFGIRQTIGLEETIARTMQWHRG